MTANSILMIELSMYVCKHVVGDTVRLAWARKKQITPMSSGATPPATSCLRIWEPTCRLYVNQRCLQSCRNTQRGSPKPKSRGDFYECLSDHLLPVAGTSSRPY